MSTKITAVRREALDARNKEAGNRIFLTRMTGGIVETDRMIRFLAERAMITQQQARAAIESIGQVITELAGLGHGVQIPNLGTITLVMKGTVNKAGEPVVSNCLKYRMKFLKHLQAVTDLETQVSYLDLDPKKPVIHGFDDAASGTENALLTPGGTAGIKGTNIRFNPTKTDEGIYLIPSGGGETVKISQILDNRTTRLSFGLPAELVGGTVYGLEVRARVIGSKILRKSSWATALTVA